MALEHIDPYPWFLNKTLELPVDDRVMRTRITASEWADHWRPLLGRLYDLWMAHHPYRFIVAVAGPPGSGKSVLAAQLFFMIDKGFLHRDCHTMTLPMDGFHFPNAYLHTHARHLPDGADIPLSYVKGQPDTIDAARLHQHLLSLIQRPEYVSWPGYTRISQDVVPDQYKVHMSVNLVIIEGSYLLLDRGPFHGIPSLFNLRIYVDAPAPKIIANLMERHMAAGKDIDQAKDWLKRIDLPNARVVETTRHQADVIIERDAEDDIAAIIWKGEEPPVARDEEEPPSQTQPPPPDAPSTPPAELAPAPPPTPAEPEAPELPPQSSPLPAPEAPPSPPSSAPLSPPPA